MFSEMHAEVGEIRDLGDRVLGLGTLWARGRESGAEVSSTDRLADRGAGREPAPRLGVRKPRGGTRGGRSRALGVAPAPPPRRPNHAPEVGRMLTLDHASEAPSLRPSWAASTAPSRRTLQEPSESSAVRSTTVEGATDQLPAVDRQVGAGQDLRIDVLEAARRRLAAAVGAGLEDRATGAGERAVDQAEPEPLGVIAAGEPVAALGIVDHQGHGAGEQRPERVARARPQRGQQLAHGQRREEHHRRGLALVAALQRVDPLDRGRARTGRSPARRACPPGRPRRPRRRRSARAPRGHGQPRRRRSRRRCH